MVSQGQRHRTVGGNSIYNFDNIPSKAAHTLDYCVTISLIRQCSTRVWRHQQAATHVICLPVNIDVVFWLWD
jgi:hypothetical protein